MHGDEELSRSSIEVMALKQDIDTSENDIKFTKLKSASTNSEFDISDDAYTTELKTAQPEINKLSGIPSIDRTRVIQLTQQIYPAAKSWLNDYPALPLKKLPTFCLTSAAISPNSNKQVVTELAIFLMLLVSIDDIIDERSKYRITTEQARQLLKEWGKIVKESGEDNKSSNFIISKLPLATPQEQLSHALTKFCHSLKTFPYAKDYYSLLSHRFNLLMNSMIVELDWQEQFITQGKQPAYQDYVINGRESIEAPTLMIALLILNGPSWEQLNIGMSASLVQKRIISQLEELLFSCGSSIRLVNDIGGFERELIEQKPNSISVLLHHQKQLLTTKLDEKMEQVFLKNVKDAVLREADNYQQQLEKQVKRLPEALADWGTSVLRITKFCHDFCLAGEFYSLSLEMLQSLKVHLN